MKQKLISVSLLFTVTSCGIHINKENPTIVQNLPQTTTDQLNYQNIKAKVLDTNCMNCHTSKDEPYLNTYSQVFAAINDIDESVLKEGSMPKTGSLTTDQLGLLSQWIQAGAPEFSAAPTNAVTSTPTPTPTPTPSPKPITSPTPEPPFNPSLVLRPVTFAAMQAELKESCTSCHYPKNPKGHTELQTYQSVLSVKEWLIPIVFGGIVDGVELQPEDLMPPPKKKRLTEKQKTYLKFWVEDGAIEK